MAAAAAVATAAAGKLQSGGRHETTAGGPPGPPALFLPIRFQAPPDKDRAPLRPRSPQPPPCLQDAEPTVSPSAEQIRPREVVGHSAARLSDSPFAPGCR